MIKLPNNQLFKMLSSKPQRIRTKLNATVMKGIGLRIVTGIAIILAVVCGLYGGLYAFIILFGVYVLTH